MKIRLAILLISLLLTAFSTWLKIKVLNNSGKNVLVLSEGKTFPLPLGGSEKFIYPTVAQQRILRISDSSCTYTYLMPDSVERYSQASGFKGAVVIQLESDYRLYAVPPESAEVVAISDAASFQQEGFPVSPIKEQCQFAK